MSKYDILVCTLDQLRKEAPIEFKRYYPLENDKDGMDYARARAFIHLFLKVKFGVLEFIERENFITDEKEDGGIDAYFIDNQHKKVYFIQSKFRMNEKNFTEKEIMFKDLLQMDAGRIVKGFETYESSVPYNDKIKKMMKKIRNIPDISRWEYEVVLLANLHESVSQNQLQRLTGFFTEVFNHERTYKELVFHVVEGTFYNVEELQISINLSNKGNSSSRIKYSVSTKQVVCQIQVLFVPTIEIAKALLKYKNSILKFNPRSFLELSNNDVNKDIARSIRDIKTNEFALYNNGITLVSSKTSYSDDTFQENTAQLMVTKPQIINGGQTAFTLCRLYEDTLTGKLDLAAFDGKEVLLKVITLPQDGLDGENDHLELIEKISNATNHQTPIDEADRRSNDAIQILLQKNIFEHYGIFYERKRGEFADGIRYGYIQRSQVLDRETFIRLCKACDMEAAEARSFSKKRLFELRGFTRTFKDPSRFHEYIFAHKCWEILAAIDKGYAKTKNKGGTANYGSGLLYGKYAIISACHTKYEGEEAILKAGEIVDSTLSEWLKFESYVVSLKTNQEYFRKYKDENGIMQSELNFNNYYKGRTINSDILRYFEKKGD